MTLYNADEKLNDWMAFHRQRHGRSIAANGKPLGSHGMLEILSSLV